MTKKAIADQKESAYVVELDNLQNFAEVKQFLNAKVKMNTYPKTFINGKFIGGNSDLQQLISNGEFKKML